MPSPSEPSHPSDLTLYRALIPIRRKGCAIFIASFSSQWSPSSLQGKMEGASSNSTRQKRKGTPNKRWLKQMDDVLIPSLAEMAKAGLKVDKSFKWQAFVETANIINRKFPAANIDADNVKNHMRTMKVKYQGIKKILALSGVGWNDDQKMIVLEDKAYRTYVESFPKDKELLNKPIQHFDDLRLVCGDDHATGEFARTIIHQFGGENNEVEGQNEGAGDDIENVPSDINNNNNEIEVARTSATTTSSKRRCSSWASSESTSMDIIGNKFDRLATSLDNSSKDWKEKMSDALWSMEGYDDDDIEMVYLTLRDNRRRIST